MGAALAAASATAAGAADTGIPDGFSIAAGGDMIGPYHPLPMDDPEFGKVIAIFKGAKLGFANQEGSIFDLPTFQYWPAPENGGGYPLQPAAMAKQMKAMGIDLVSKANNHATDYGTEGLVATLGSLAEAHIAQGGAGLSEAEARAAGYVETPSGLIALVDTASTFPPLAVAGPPINRRGNLTKPRPGISALHVREIKLVTRRQLLALSKASGQAISKAHEVRISDQVFRLAKTRGTAWEMEKADEDAILASIAAAHAKARFVAFSIHAHETAGDIDDLPVADWEPMILHKANEAPSPNDPRPAAFEPVLFHAAIDAGADIVLRTGPHQLNGIEIYKGRPIFYGLGSLFYDFGGRTSYTAPSGAVMHFPEEWFETVIPVSTYKDNRLSELKLYPMVISSSDPATSGIPHPANPERARKILKRLQAISKMFGTQIVIEDGVGVIRPG